MAEVRCIYCNKSNVETEINESHIFPDGLTNCTKSINRNLNVCKILHNRKFGDTFECNVITQLAQLRNLLDIKNKNGKIPQFQANVDINGYTITKKLTHKSDFYDMKHPYPAKKDNKDLRFGKVEDLKLCSSKPIMPLDLSTANISLDVTPPFSLFYSLDMFRLVSKISYEWFCKENNIIGKLDKFNEIINFIITGQGECPVEIVTDSRLYFEIYKSGHVTPNSHLITFYLDVDNYIYSLVSLFGLIFYKVKLYHKAIPNIQIPKFNFTELRVDGSVNTFQIILKEPYSYNTLVCSLNARDENVHFSVCNILKKTYPRTLQTKLLTINSLKPSVEKVRELLNISNVDELYNKLIGMCDDKLIIAIYILSKLDSNYNFSISFNDNLLKILDSDAQNTVWVNNQLLIKQFASEFYNGSLIESIKEGIEVFDKAQEQNDPM